MTYQSEIYKASQLIVKHIAKMKENKYKSIQMQAVDFEAFYHKVLEIAERADVSNALFNATNYGKDVENIKLLKSYGEDIEFLKDLAMKLAKRCGVEYETMKHILSHVLLKEINELENNHNQVQKKE